MKKIKIVLHIFILLGFIIGPMAISVRPLYAASVTTFSDTLSRLKASTASNHEILFVTPTGVTTGQTVIFTFTGFGTLAGLGPEDFDLATGSTAVCTSATYTEQNVQASNGAANWGVAVAATTATFTAPSSGTPVSANKCIRVRIGLNATTTTGTGPGDTQITNGSAGTATLAISGNFGDSGTAAIAIIADDQVVITATVAPTFTFTIDDNAIGFGTLSSGAARYATANAAGSASDTVANSFTVATNAAFGYTLTYNGATLTSGLNTIGAATITADADGTPGTEQFALSAAVTGTGTVASGYDHANPDWKFVASTTSTLTSATAAASDTINIRYLANIAGTTPAGSYATTLTYVATGNF